MGRNSRTTAPTITPESDERPPITTLARRRMESVTGKVSGLMYETWIANSAPATPAYAAEIPKASLALFERDLGLPPKILESIR
jgi:hypothetical protein